MGCVSSKAVTRSRSFQEQLGLSLQGRTNGLPGVEDLLANNKGGGDQFLALLCTANTVAKKLRAGNAAIEEGKLSSHPTTDPENEEKVTVAAITATEEPTSPETINTWELMADLEQEDDGEQSQHQQQQHLLQHPQELTHSCSLRDGEGVSRSRSFRTVEDFDAMVTGNSSSLVLKESHGIPSKNHPPDSGEQAQVEDASRDQDNEEGEGSSRDGDAHQAPDGSDCSGREAEPEPPDVHSMVFSQSPSTREPTTAGGNGVAGARSFAELKGLRRRELAKELKALKVPSFEFSSVGSLREWLGGGGQVFSPGSYVTPRFGSFGSQAAAEAARDGGDAGRDKGEALLDPLLVADLEDATERLTMEEENILSQIVETLQGSHGEDSEGCIDM